MACTVVELMRDGLFHISKDYNLCRTNRSGNKSPFLMRFYGPGAESAGSANSSASAALIRG